MSITSSNYSENNNGNGKHILEGEFKSWHPNGQLKVMTFYQNELLEGDYREWYPNGQLMDRWNFQNGLAEGERRLWHENGHLSIREYFRDGTREGKHESFLDSGHPLHSRFYQNGRIEGEYKIWRDDGRIERHIYKNSAPRDSWFGLKKKFAVLCIKRRLRPSIHIHSYIISDLLTIIG